MAYVPVTFVADEILTSTKMNQLGANDASFHDGTGISDGSITPSKVGNFNLGTDDNGWAVSIGSDGKKTWRKRGSSSGAFSAGAWSRIANITQFPIGLKWSDRTRICIKGTFVEYQGHVLPVLALPLNSDNDTSQFDILQFGTLASNTSNLFWNIEITEI